MSSIVLKNIHVSVTCKAGTGINIFLSDLIDFKKGLYGMDFEIKALFNDYIIDVKYDSTIEDLFRQWNSI